jgi:nucleotide-binding universal stress UspA family protein
MPERDASMSGVTVGIDGSRNSHHALEWAIKEAAVRDAPLTVLTVNQLLGSIWTGDPLSYPGDDERLAKARKAAEEAVAAATADAGDMKPTSVSVIATNGFVVRELLSASETADLLVLGTRGGGGFETLRLGSVSSQVIHHAKCPVVVVPHTK